MASALEQGVSETMLGVSFAKPHKGILVEAYQNAWGTSWQFVVGLIWFLNVLSVLNVVVVVVVVVGQTCYGESHSIPPHCCSSLILVTVTTRISTCLVVDPNLNFHFPLASWVGDTPNEHSLNTERAWIPMNAVPSPHILDVSNSSVIVAKLTSEGWAEMPTCFCHILSL